MSHEEDVRFLKLWWEDFPLVLSIQLYRWVPTFIFVIIIFIFYLFSWVWYNSKDCRELYFSFQLMTPLQWMEDIYQQAGDSLQHWITCIVMLLTAWIEWNKTYNLHKDLLVKKLKYFYESGVPYPWNISICSYEF